MQSQLSPEETVDEVTSPYFMFKYSIRSELTRKYYERRLRTFFDFIDFSVKVPQTVTHDNRLDVNKGAMAFWMSFLKKYHL